MATKHHTKATRKHRIQPRMLLVIVGVALLPLIYGGLLTSAYQDPAGRISHVQAAVVNEDVPATVTTSSGNTETVSLGQSLTDALTKPEDGKATGFTWTEMPADEAQKALSDQKVRAVLTVPAGLSAGSSILAEGRAPTGDTPQLDLVTDDGISYLSGSLATQVAATLQKQVSTQGATTYVDGLLVAMSTVKDGLGQGADGAGKLAAGADTLQSGADELATGASTAAAGTRTLHNGAQTLASGAGRLSDGMGTMAAGASTAAGGAGTLNDGLQALEAGAQSLQQGTLQYTEGVQKAADGAATLADGSTALTALSDGVGTYTGAVDAAAASVPQLTDGASAVASGANSLRDGVTQLSTGLGAPDAAADATSQQLVPATKAYVAGVHQLNDALSSPDLATATGAVNQVWGETKEGLDDLFASLNDLAATCQQEDPAGPICAKVLEKAGAISDASAKVGQLDQAVTGVTGAVTQASAATTQLATAGDKLETGVVTLASKVGTDPASSDQTLLSGATTLADGSAQLNSRIGTVTDSATAQQQAGQAPTLAGVLNDVSSQSNQLRTGAASSTKLIDGAQQVSGGLNQLTAKSGDVTDGAEQVSAATGKLAAGTAEMSAKIGDLVSGTATLASASDQVAAGSASLAAGTDTLASGTDALDTGASTLANGTKPLADGATTLENSLAAGADKVPTYTESERGDVATRAANVADVTTSRDHAVANNGAGFLPMFLSLALWVGCIGVFFVFPALKRTSENEPWWKAAVRQMPIMAAFSVAQALLLVLVVNWTVGIEAHNLLGLSAMAVLVSFTFMLINQAAVASLGLVGRFVSLILIVFQIASMGATFPIETSPAFFGAIHPWLPMSYAQLAFRDLIAGGGATNIIPQAIGVLLAWAFGALAITFIAARVRKGVDLQPGGKKDAQKEAEAAA